MPKNMKTYSGVRYDPFNMTVDDIRIYDIASQLSKICRWLGTTKVPYTVAQHSIAVSYSPRLKTDREKLAGLLHDAAETYTGDIPTPIKIGIPQLKELDNAITKIVFEKFDLLDQFPLSERIHSADKEELNREDASLNLVQIEGNKLPSMEHYGYVDCDEAKEAFIHRFIELGGIL